MSAENNKYPDLSSSFDPYSLAKRDSFRYKNFVFKRTRDGAYRNGNVVVYHDQQDSTSWAAKCGNKHTGYFWAPEFALDNLLDTTILMEANGNISTDSEA